MRILIIDDSENDRLLTRREISKEFPEAGITEIASRRELETALNGSRPDVAPDVAIVDYALGWGEGISISKELKGRFPDCPVIMFTGTLGEEYAVLAMKSGLDDYIIKDPNRLPRLRASIHAVLRQTKDRAALRLAEADRDVLLQEVLHRVHNNLQIVLGLLRMHGKNAAEAATRILLDDITQRVQALAHVQGRLLMGGNYRALDFDAYLHDLAVAFAPVGARGRDIALKTRLTPLQVPLELAAPLGLIANELLTNAFEHAFPDRDSGAVWIELENGGADGEAVMMVCDDGIGMAKPWSQGIGSQLVRMLARQSGAVLEIDARPGGGTRARVTFSFLPRG